MSITKTLFPPANRQAAAVAFLRTFWQVIRPPLVIGSLALVGVESSGVLHVNLKTLGLVAGAVVLAALASGALAAGDILSNGLPAAYHAAVVASIPVAQVSAVPVVTPSDPGQPAAGTQPDVVAIAAGTPPVSDDSIAAAVSAVLASADSAPSSSAPATPAAAPAA